MEIEQKAMIVLYPGVGTDGSFHPFRFFEISEDRGARRFIVRAKVDNDEIDEFIRRQPALPYQAYALRFEMER